MTGVQTCALPISLAHILVRRDEAAVAGTDGIDEDEIGEVEPGVGIGLQIRRGGGHRGVPRDRQPPGSGIAELQIGRGRTGPAIEHEGHRTGGRIGAIKLVGGISNVGLRFAGAVEQPDRTRGGGEGEIGRASCRERV